MNRRRQRIPGMMLGTTAVGTAVLSQALGSIGGSVATQGQQGLQNMSQFFPVMGTIEGGAMTLQAVRRIGRYRRR